MSYYFKRNLRLFNWILPNYLFYNYKSINTFFHITTCNCLLYFIFIHNNLNYNFMDSYGKMFSRCFHLLYFLTKL